MQRSIRYMAILLATCSASLLSTGCNGLIYDDQGDCSVHYKVAFTYTMNMLNADAFSSQVSSVTLYVVDKEGNIVTSKKEQGAALEAPGYVMDVDVAPGTYDLLVWAEGASPVADPTEFVIANGATPTAITALSASLPLSDNESGKYCDKDIVPLYHGLLRDVEFPDTYGDVIVGPVDLTKDTNVIQVLLQTTDGSEISSDDFTFSITADNSELDYTNLPVGTVPVNYYPWSVTQTSASFDKPGGGSGNEEGDQSGEDTRADGVNGLLAELSTGRLMADRHPILTITRHTDQTELLSMDLVKYFLMVKGEYNKPVSDQGYLDRCSNYTLMFFIDREHNWYTAAGIYINGWRVVPPQNEEL